jgi:hypothetical protein
MKSKSLRLIGVIASQGHICYLGKPINGSCKITKRVLKERVVVDE